MATTKKKLTHEDYVVGWIYPMRVEYTAALLMLDEEHKILGQDVADGDIYTLGSINGNEFRNRHRSTNLPLRHRLQFLLGTFTLALRV